jgi:hypothetical protein
MPKTRTKSGRFEASMVVGTYENGKPAETILPQIPLSRIWVWRIMIYFVTFLVMSPWLFLMIRKQSLNGISQKVSEFYDDNFSCRSWENLTSMKPDAKSNSF